MKRNTNIDGLVNFLIPIITIYAVFLVIYHIEEGLSAILYSATLLLIINIIYFFSRNKIEKITLTFSSKIAIKLFYLLSFSYIIYCLIILLN